MNTDALSCPLCLSLKPENAKSFYNRPIYETENFTIIPSIGPLVLGHVLVVSKIHAECLALMGIEKIEELRLFILNTILKKSRNKDILFFEHGSFDGNNGGACVIHTHIHMIPNYGINYNIFDGVLKIFDTNFNSEKLANIDMPYILSFNSSNDVRIYEAYNVHSQMMQKAICSKMRIKEWDWRKDRKEALIHESLKYWENILSV